ncbi:MAG: hypothetical protein LBU81_02825 [Methanosarcinales archaeon]|jgi:hypothetical protein|nr:hypothetical protein [Methanosarcinales archaeon]
MGILTFDNWRITIAETVTKREGFQNSEQIRAALYLNDRREARDYMRELARRNPAFKFSTCRNKSELRYTPTTGAL